MDNIETKMVYDKSPTLLKKQGAREAPPRKKTDSLEGTEGSKVAATHITFYAGGVDRITYDSLIGGGDEVIELPLRKPIGGQTLEKIRAKNLPGHVASRIEQSIFTEAFYKTRDDPHVIFGHYVGVLQGMSLADAPTLKHLNQLVKGLASATDPGAYFKAEIKPYLLSLRPKAR